jgi:hypothetical protein
MTVVMPSAFAQFDMSLVPSIRCEEINLADVLQNFPVVPPLSPGNI